MEVTRTSAFKHPIKPLIVSCALIREIGATGSDMVALTILIVEDLRVLGTESLLKLFELL